MIVLGAGRLKMGISKFGTIATDGVSFFRVLSPRLRHIMKRKKRDNSVVGKFLLFNDVIVLFHKENTQ